MKSVFEKIKERLRTEKAELTTWAEDMAFELGIDKAIEIVNQVAEEYNQSLTNNNQSLTNGGWIPCSERLPEDNEIHECTALFNTGMRYIEYAYYDVAREEWWTHDDTGLVNVIAWKSSPQPYKPEGE